MNMTGEHNRLRLTLLSLICFLALAVASLAQDVTITNLTQLADVAFSANYSLYLPWTPWQIQACPTDGGEPWWMDCSQVTCADLLSTSTNSCATLQMHGITVTFVTLTKNILTGETLLSSGCSTDVIATIAAPSGYDPGTLLGENAWVWRQWQQITNCLDCWGLTADEIPPPIVTLRTRLADASTYSIYQSNVEAEAEAAAAAWASSASGFTAGGRFTMMSEDDDEMDDSSCTVSTDEFAVIGISQDTNGWTTVIVGPTCTNYLVGWFSVDALCSNSLSTNATWASRAGGWAGDNTSTWCDQTTAGLTQRFYRAILNLPTTNSDWNGDGIPDVWEADQGLNPFDSNTGSETSTNPWAHGLTNLQVYQNQSVLISNNYTTLNDGIPDWWRVMYFGASTTTDVSSCATCDPDEDFVDNLHEYLAGTDPTNSTDFPALTFTINGGTNPVTSTQLHIELPQGIVADYVVIAEDVLFTNSVTNVFSSAFNYTLSNSVDGLQTVFLQLLKADDTMSMILGGTIEVNRNPPLVSITAPTNGAVIAQQRVNIQGSATDATTNSTSRLQVTVNGDFINNRDTNGNWWAGPENLTPGTNTFIAVATALAGLSTTGSVTVVYDPTLATNTPNFTLDVTNTVTVGSNATTIAVSGGIDDSNATIQITVLDALDTTITNVNISAAVNGTNWWANVPVVAGSNIVIITAQNSGSAPATNGFAMIQNPNVFLEITGPTADTAVNAHHRISSRFGQREL